MARRRTRRRPPARSGRGLLAWLAVCTVAAALGWLWWHAAYRPGLPVGSSVPEPPFAGPAGRADRSGGPPATPAPRGNGGSAPVPSPTPGPIDLEYPTPPPVVVVPPTPPVEAAPQPSPARSGPEEVMAMQLALVRRGISSGPIDGVFGSQTRAALRIFQRREGLPATGVMDGPTRERLTLDEPVLGTYTVTADDLARLTPVPSSWLGKSSRERLDYESVLELVSEKNQAHPRLVRQLNPQVDWHRVAPGTVIKVPVAALPPLQGKAGFVRISLAEKALRVFDSSSNLVAHFPCSIARKVEKRPLGQLHVVRLAPNPNYRFDPDIFQESEEARRIGRLLIIPPGPNNPVGTAWIGLDRPGYGIHGTPHPEDVGRTESHGCFRLANWNAEFLLKAAWVGMPVYVEP